MWPCVTRLQSMVGVWPVPWQDTWLAPPPCISLAARAQYSQLVQGHTPLAIVICPGLKCASIVAELTQNIPSKSRLGGEVVLACAGARNNELSDFNIGVEVLVTSPPWLLMLMGQAMTSMDRCCHLVVEEGDCTIPMWHKQAGEIRKKQNYSSPIQLVIHLQTMT